MEDLKITVEIKNSLGNGVEYEYDLDIIRPYLDQLLVILSEAEMEQNCKNDAKFFDEAYAKIMAEINKKEPKPKAKNRKKTAKEILDEMRKEADAFFGNAGWRIYRPNNTTVNIPLRDSKGRFAKKDSKKK